jgi:hypothetical protein
MSDDEPLSGPTYQQRLAARLQHGCVRGRRSLAARVNQSLTFGANSGKSVIWVRSLPPIYPKSHERSLAPLRALDH